MSFPTPDIRSMTEAGAKAALVAAGVPSGATIVIGPALWTSEAFVWNDADHLGESGGTYGGQFAETAGPVGALSWQFPEPGDAYNPVFPDFVYVNVWGLVEGDIEGNYLEVSLADWTTTPETTAATYASGGGLPEPFPLDSDTWFRVEVTTQHTPDGAGGVIAAEVLFEFAEFADVSVKIAINDARQAEVTVSMWAAELETNDLIDFEHYLRIYYRDQPQPVFWGPLRTEDDYAAGTVKITAVDAHKLQRQFARFGDEALNDPDDPEVGALTVDWRGIQNLLAAAQNTDEQVARGMPVLGISMGDASSTRSTQFEVRRGDNIWDRIIGISSAAGGPDFELAPVDDVPGVYAYLNPYDSQGTDRGRDADFENGILYTFGAPPDVGADNLTNVRARRLNPITHAHVLDDSREHRVTAADADSSEAIGAYIEWVQSAINLVGGDVTVLEEIAQAYVDAYGRPPHAIDLDLRPDPHQEWFYNEDFFIGDIVSVYATKGYRGVINTHMRIIAVELTQPDKRGPAVTKLSVVPYVARTITDEDA